MFSNLFFLILNLLLISSTIDQTTSLFLAEEPGTAFGLFLLGYLFFLVFLHQQCQYLQKKFHYRKEHMLFLANIELLLFFSFFYFFLGAQRWPVLHFNPFGITLFSLLSLSCYFIALFLYHYSCESLRNRYSAFSNAWLSLCFLLPFVLPFLILAFINEASALLPIDQLLNSWGIKEQSFGETVLYSLLNLLVILLTLIFLPPLAVLIWHCPKLKDSALKTELDELCQRANFHHAGFKIWRIMNNSMTAAIIGVVSKLRYILFTQKLIDNVPNHAIVAILAHEIGHSYYLHLFFYPFILLGMVIVGSIIPTLLYAPVLQLTTFNELLPTLLPILMFLLFGLTMAVYFRYVFGYFSRIFERQADLHIFKLNIPASHMIEALDTLAVSAGHIHNEPNWHHYSIQERIDTINQADEDRSLITRQSKIVRWSLIIYFIVLVISIITLWYLIS